MRIREFAKMVGLSEYTLRYYEKVGVLRPAQRDRSGFRDFSEMDLAWMEFVQRLKATGMPLEEIVRYATLREQGEATKAERLALLERHERRVSGKLEEQIRHLEKIRAKIQFYKS
jgi:MerR family transcriptional regulator, aldehyde-responsive regulator